MYSIDIKSIEKSSHILFKGIDQTLHSFRAKGHFPLENIFLLIFLWRENLFWNCAGLQDVVHELAKKLGYRSRDSD